MQVFSIDFDYKRYQMIGTMPGLIEKHPHPHVRAPFLEGWEPLVATVNNPRKLRGDFLLCGLSYLVCRHDITAAFGTCVRDVQVLPVRLKGEEDEYHLWNVGTFIDALDMANTQFKPPPLRSLPLNWSFKPECIDRPMLFRTPEVPSHILAASGFASRKEGDFYLRYKELKLKGLRFDLEWEYDEQDV
jgi:hypothetical protein